MQLEKDDIKGIHGPNERISISTYKSAINFYFDFYNHLSNNNSDFYKHEL